MLHPCNIHLHAVQICTCDGVLSVWTSGPHWMFSSRSNLKCNLMFWNPFNSKYTLIHLPQRSISYRSACVDGVSCSSNPTKYHHRSTLVACKHTWMGNIKTTTGFGWRKKKHPQHPLQIQNILRCFNICSNIWRFGLKSSLAEMSKQCSGLGHKLSSDWVWPVRSLAER